MLTSRGAPVLMPLPDSCCRTLSECARLFALVNSRSFFVCSALLLLLFANSAFAGGAYQRTKDRKTRVWNNYPQPGDAATWSGDRDADRYATDRKSVV